MKEVMHRITSEVLQKTISSELGVDIQEVKVMDFKVTEGCNKGDNYLCVMKAVEVVAEVEGQERRLFYMAKCMPFNMFRVNLLKEVKVFDVEITMYMKILPALRELDSRISAPLVFYADAEKGIIVMEDLKKQDYFMMDKAIGLDMVQIKLLLEQLAFFHASSFHFIENKGGENKFEKDFQAWNDADTSELFKEFVEMFAQQEDWFITIIEEHCKDKQRLVQKLKEFSTKKAARLEEVLKPQGSFNCILHNDVWCNNVLYSKGEDGQVNKVKILDFQLCRRGRPSVDLAFFFGSSTSPELRKDHLVELLQFYHDNLTQSLEELGHNQSVYSFEQLKKDFAECYTFGFCVSQRHAMMHLIPSDNTDAVLDLNELKEGTNLKEFMMRYREGQLKQVRENPRLRKRLIGIALEAEELGVI